MTPDDDWAIGQNEVDVRNEARRSRTFFACLDPEGDWIRDQQELAADGENPKYGTNNPDWEHDREREEQRDA